MCALRLCILQTLSLTGIYVKPPCLLEWVTQRGIWRITSYSQGTKITLPKQASCTGCPRIKGSDYSGVHASSYLSTLGFAHLFALAPTNTLYLIFIAQSDRPQPYQIGELLNPFSGSLSSLVSDPRFLDLGLFCLFVFLFLFWFASYAPIATFVRSDDSRF